MSAPLRNKPIDRRRLSRRDRNDYNRSGYPRAARAERRVRRFAGQRMAQLNRRPDTTNAYLSKTERVGFEPTVSASLRIIYHVNQG